jgi:hypothetical protein
MAFHGYFCHFDPKWCDIILLPAISPLEQVYAVGLLLQSREGYNEFQLNVLKALTYACN